MPNIKPVSDLRNYNTVLNEDSTKADEYFNSLLNKGVKKC